MPRAKKQRKQPIPQARRLHAVPKLKPIIGSQLPAIDESRKQVLHLGWSSAVPGRIAKDFPAGTWQEIRYDPDTAVTPDMSGPLDSLSTVPDQSMDAVYVPQLLQRFAYHRVAPFLAETKRMLKEGGLLALTVPNGQLAASYIATEQPALVLYSTGLGPITPLDLIGGLRVGQAKGQEQHYHRSIYTPEALGLLLRDQGFSNITVTAHGYEITATARRYAFDNPARVEKITVARQNAAKAANVDLPPIPAGTDAAISKPRMAAGGKSMADELDLPPVVWTPMGIRKK